MPVSNTAATPDELLADDMGRFFDDALGFVMYAYDWDNDPELQLVELPEPWCFIYNSKYGPDAWACELLDRISQQVREHGFDGFEPVAPIREAIASGHGIGKSAITAWIVDWIMSTRPFAQGTVTANTAPQLETKTWAQIAKWTKKCITGHWFNIKTGKGSMKMSHKDYPDSWFCSAQTCREENSEAFAGQHAANSTSFYIFDEASAVPDKIKEVAEGGLTDGEPMMFAFGNPTRNTGWFHDCFHGQAHRWHTCQIDSRSVQITNKKQIQEWVDDYGLDSDFVKVRVRGLFPSLSARQFISVEDIDAAYGRHLRPEQYEWAPKIIGVDPAWEGDDELVIGLRQGLKFQILRVLPKNDNDIQVANIIADLEDQHQADAVFIDAGYGTGIVSAGRTWKRDWQLVWFGSKSDDPSCKYKRDQLWKASRDWLKEGGSIPEDPVLRRDAIGTEIIARTDGVTQIESKKDLKARGEQSPNRWDCLITTFAYPVTSKKSQRLPVPQPHQQRKEYDPYARMDRKPNNTRGSYNPYND